MIRLELPFPPGVNNLFKNTGRGRARTARYEAWAYEAGLKLRRQRPGSIPGHFRVEMTFDRPDQRRRDLDGLAKAPLDLLVTLGVIADDSLAQEIILRWGEPTSPPDARVVLVLGAAHG